MGTNVRNLNWDELEERALGGAGEVVRKVKFRHSPIFLCILFGITFVLAVSNRYVLHRLGSVDQAKITLQCFSADLATLQELDANLQLDLVLRDKVGIQKSEPLIRFANRKHAALVGQAWTNVRRQALLNEIPGDLLKKAKSATDLAVVAVSQESRALRGLSGTLGGFTITAFILSILACLSAIKKGSTTLVVQSLGRESNRASREAETHKETADRALTLVQNMPLALIEFESDGRILRWNGSAEALLGIPADMALRQGIIDCIGWSNAKEMARSTIRRLFTGDGVEDLVWQYRHPSGEILQLRAKFATIADRSGTARSAVMTVIDVTTEKQNQEMLVSTDLTRTAILKALPETLLRFSAHNELVEVHDNGFILGDQVEKCYKLGWQQQFDEELVASILQGIKLARLSQRPISFEHTGQLLGKEVALEFRLTASAQSETVVVVDDVSDRERAAMADQRSELRFRELLEHAADPMVMLSAENIILYASNAISDILGVENANVTGQNWLALVDKENRPDAEQFIADLLAHPGRTIRASLELNSAAGVAKPVELTGRNLLEHDSVRSIVLNLRDISERRRLESALQQKVRELEVSNERLLQANTLDPLTGVLNHSTVLEYLSAICQFAEEGGQFSAVLLDIDQFKDFNAAYGFGEGDELLRTAANCVREACRAEDIVGRCGSEEFLVILPELGEADATKVVERIEKRFVHRSSHPASLSAGIVTVQNQAIDATDVIANLTAALEQVRAESAA